MITFTVQPDWRVLVLEDTAERVTWFKERLPHAVYATTADEAMRALESQEFRVVFLDHDLHWMHVDNSIFKGTGKEVATHLAKMKFEGVVVIHSKNDVGVRSMAKILPSAKIARFGEFEIAQK